MCEGADAGDSRRRRWTQPGVLDLLAHLKARGVEVWLDGGWAVDALLGEQTRAHDDLDVVARLDDGARIEQALGERGYAPAAGAPPSSFELVDGEGHRSTPPRPSAASAASSVTRFPASRPRP